MSWLGWAPLGAKVVALAGVAVVGMGGLAATMDTPQDVTGRLTFNLRNWITHESFGVAEVTLPGGEEKRLVTGAHGWRHADGTVVHLQGCGERVNRLVLTDPNGRASVVSPCSHTVENRGYSPTAFEFSRLSPDKQRIAVEARFYLNNAWRYATIVYENGEIVQIYDGFAAPAWLPDGRLILTGEGLFTAEIGQEPTRLDDGSLGWGPNNPDPDPTGRRIVFEWNQRLWLINIDGSGLEELVSGSSAYRFPAWSPDGGTIAFLASDGPDRMETTIYFLDMASREYEQLTLSGDLTNRGMFRPQGPLSWIR